MTAHSPELHFISVFIRQINSFYRKLSQQLLPDKEGKLIPAFELMTVNRAIKNMIRDNKVHQIDGLIGSSGQEKMFSMDSYITKLYKEGKITRETALDYATAPELMAQKLLERV